ncbi:hypothetical protein ISCGN_025138 [Ixodes scapularis]
MIRRLRQPECMGKWRTFSSRLSMYDLYAGGGRGQRRTGMAGPGRDFSPFAMLIALRQHVVTRSRADEFSLLTDGSKERASPKPRATLIDVTAHVTRKMVKELRGAENLNLCSFLK